MLSSAVQECRETTAFLDRGLESYRIGGDRFARIDSVGRILRALSSSAGSGLLLLHHHSIYDSSQKASTGSP
jgi:hypothetical protein